VVLWLVVVMVPRRNVSCYAQVPYIYDISCVTLFCSFVYHLFLAPILVISSSFLVYLEMLFSEEAKYLDRV